MIGGLVGGYAVEIATRLLFSQSFTLVRKREKRRFYRPNLIVVSVERLHPCEGDCGRNFRQLVPVCTNLANPASCRRLRFCGIVISTDCPTHLVASSAHQDFGERSAIDVVAGRTIKGCSEVRFGVRASDESVQLARRLIVRCLLGQYGA